MTFFIFETLFCYVFPFPLRMGFHASLCVCNCVFVNVFVHIYVYACVCVCMCDAFFVQASQTDIIRDVTPFSVCVSILTDIV